MRYGRVGTPVVICRLNGAACYCNHQLSAEEERREQEREVKRGGKESKEERRGSVREGSEAVENC